MWGQPALGCPAGQRPASPLWRTNQQVHGDSMRLLRIAFYAACLAAIPSFAATVASVRGVIHDPQHRPVENAMVMIKAKSSDWSATANSDAGGNFAFNAIPLGEYVVTVAGVGFEQAQQGVAVIS